MVNFNSENLYIPSYNQMMINNLKPINKIKMINNINSINRRIKFYKLAQASRLCLLTCRSTSETLALLIFLVFFHDSDRQS